MITEDAKKGDRIILPLYLINQTLLSAWPDIRCRLIHIVKAARRSRKTHTVSNKLVTNRLKC